VVSGTELFIPDPVFRCIQQVWLMHSTYSTYILVKERVHSFPVFKYDEKKTKLHDMRFKRLID
jgi:hypothetical protein